MTYFKKILLVSIITLSLISCGRNKVEKEINPDSDNEITEQKDTATITTIQKEGSTSANSPENHSDTKGSILSETHFSKKADSVAEDKEESTPTINNANPSVTNTTTKKVSAPSNYTIQKILNGCEIGEILSQDDLSKHLEIPKDAIKLVKSVTKLSEDEIDVKWNSTWAVEKLSDAKFKDGIIKARFTNNSVYISGGAIGIKYDRKIYTDLVVTGRKAHIPSVKGFYWKIGRD